MIFENESGAVTSRETAGSHMVKILRAEQMEDLVRLAGIASPEQGAAAALHGPLFRRFRLRLPWLVFGLFASSVITFVVAGFEYSLSTNVTVAG